MGGRSLIFAPSSHLLSRPVWMALWMGASYNTYRWQVWVAPFRLVPKVRRGHFAAPPGARGYDWPRSRCGGEARGRSAAVRSIAATPPSLSLSLSFTGHVLL